ncbi:hypothetical protein GSI_00013 [Ganoderma sinense ZZ0214-1]|uniref:Ribosome maturation protein SDO1/SBDS C-terminal domain-containing protein n=1 Tax=Ganoderma sinense ZZ0214-1 TaxID=1077348 RepID=A0A2G8SRC7_9APHY|nr:hypothetical protein GSI_00013 [Ganoderma sinense ZZ0214-1]
MTRVPVPAADAERVKEKVLGSAEAVEKDELGGDEWETVMLIDPGQIRVINELLQKECKGRARLETLTFAATAGS